MGTNPGPSRLRRRFSHESGQHRILPSEGQKATAQDTSGEEAVSSIAPASTKVEAHGLDTKALREGQPQYSPSGGEEVVLIYSRD